MKKLLNYSLGLIVIVFLLSACATTKEGRTMKNSINGSWILQTINTEGINAKFTAKIFNETDFNCFIGSNWNFNSTNSLGSYSLTGGTTGCATLQRNVRWSVYEPKGATPEFQFKRLDDKLKPLDDNSGFRLTVSTLNNTTMQLRSAITFEGKPGNIIYNFIKK